MVEVVVRCPHWSRCLLSLPTSRYALSALACTIIYWFNDKPIYGHGDNEFTTCNQGISFTIIEADRKIEQSIDDPVSRWLVGLAGAQPASTPVNTT